MLKTSFKRTPCSKNLQVVLAGGLPAKFMRSKCKASAYRGFCASSAQSIDKLAPGLEILRDVIKLIVSFNR